MGWAAESWLLYGLALREAARSALDTVRGGLLGVIWRVPKPERLLFAPRDLRTSDPTDAADMEAGLFTFAGRVVDTHGRSPFASVPPTRAWGEALYGFGWLRHHKAAGTGTARENARSIVAEAIGPRSRQLNRGVGRDPQVVARRVISFLCQSPVLLNGADGTFYARFLNAIGRGVAALEYDAKRSRVPVERLAAATALSYAALCCSGLENRLRRATRLLSTELDRQILQDGGHVTRNPGVLVDLLLDLLPLRLLYKSRGIDAPPALSLAIERMMPMVRFLRHGSGELALFNGMGATAMDRLATLLSYDVVRAPVPVRAPVSGYERLGAGDTLVLLDCGAAPPRASSAAAAAGCLSFELSDGGRRIVVNGGAARVDSETASWRGTAAHSTLELDARPSAILLNSGRGRLAGWLARRMGPVVLAGPKAVKAEREVDGDGATVLNASHDGYAKRFGVTHERSVKLSRDGGSLAGEDRLLSADGQRPVPACAIRFHLHPSVQVEYHADGGDIVLHTPRGPGWRFSAEGALPVVADSVYRGGQEGWRPTRQILLRTASTDGSPFVPVRWRFERHSLHEPEPTFAPEAEEELGPPVDEVELVSDDSDIPATPDTAVPPIEGV